MKYSVNNYFHYEIINDFFSGKPKSVQYEKYQNNNSILSLDFISNKSLGYI